MDESPIFVIPSSPCNSQYYNIAGLTLQVQTDFPIRGNTFHPKFERFRAEVPGDDTITVRHHIGLPELDRVDRSAPVYRQVPWEVHRQAAAWLYLGIPADEKDAQVHLVAVFNRDYSQGTIFHPDEASFRSGNLSSLTLLPTDQILLAQVLADRQACYLHACGLVINRQGLAFVGHSEAGKTTIARMLQGEGELLCDDRIIVRRWQDGFRLHGSWSHGDIPDVSAGSAPLRAVFLLEQSAENRLIRLERREAVRALPEFVVKPLVTRDWWALVLDTLGGIAREVPVYRLRFDKSGDIKYLVRGLLNDPNA